MSRSPHFDAARKMIDDFAEQLLALNGGKKIPPHWSIYLEKAIRPKSEKAGRKFDLSEVKKVVRAVIRAGDGVTNQRTKHHNPAEHKDHIATETCTSRKTVERRIKDIARYFAQDSTLRPELREAILEGISDELATQVLGEIDIGEREEARQRSLKSRTPK